MATFPSPSSPNPPDSSGDSLSPADQAAFDALLDSATGDKSGSVDVARRERAAAWLAVLGAGPGPVAPAGLAARTFAAVRADGVAGRRVEAAGRRWRLPRRWAEMGALAVAASVLIAILMPGIGRARAEARRTRCAANLTTVAGAMGTYAEAYSGELPNLGVSADGSWLPHDASVVAPRHDVPHSNTANLLALVRDGLPASKLECPARDEAGGFDGDHADIPDGVRGYSYINLFGAVRPRWDGQHTTIILADRNPLFADGRGTNAHVNSLNHGARGTNVVATDGSVRWESSPDIGPDGDNIWTIGRECGTTYTGHEVVATVRDIFLSP